MNPHACRIVLRPRTPFESLDMAMAFLRVNAGVFARLSLVVLGPVAVVVGALAAVLPSPEILLVALVLAAPLLQVPFTLLAAMRVFDGSVGVADVLRALRRGWRAFPLVLLALFVSVGLATISLGMLWLPAQVALLWVIEAAALENLAVRPALARSLSLSSNGFGRALLGTLVSAALLVWVVVGAELLGQGLVGFVLQLGTPFGSMWNAEVTPFLLGGVLVAQPLIALYRLILYVDLRTAVEGWDLQVALSSAAVSA